LAFSSRNEMKNFSYLEPTGTKEALAFLAQYEGRARILAGGTDLVPQLKKGLFAPEAIISLGKIGELRRVSTSEEGLEIGAMVTLGALERNLFLSAHYPALRDALAHVAVPSIRNVATLGGNVCLDTKCIYRDQVHTWERNLEPCFKLGGKRCYVVREGTRCHASLAADTAPVLVASEAKAKILSSTGERTVPIDTLYTGNGIRPLQLREEILAQISLPAFGRGRGAAYRRYSMRKALDFQKASAAVSLTRDGERCSSARIVLGGVAPGPIRLIESEKFLNGKSVSDDLLWQVARKGPDEALRITASGRLDDVMAGVVSTLLFDSFSEAWARTKDSGERE
jgi:4-hydroxybenzoyl-CoA reductase subunit beta